jgi:peptidoglycan-associated lipoprotein
MFRMLGYLAQFGSALRHVATSRSPAVISVRASAACRRFPLWLLALLLVSACATQVPPAEGDRGGGTESTVGAEEGGDGGAAIGETSRGDMPPLDHENSVYFGLASTRIDDAGRQVLRRHAAKLQADPKLTVTLSGYTDDLGSREYNVALGQKRVDAVEQELRALHVPAKQIRKRTYGYEKARPQRCVSEACRQSLRRVELNYID